MTERVRLVWHAFGDADIEAVRDVLSSQQLVNGPAGRQLESLLANMCATSHCAVCSSGTAALHLGLLAAGVRPGDSVVLPAATFVATANVVEAIGAHPVFVDVRQSDFNMDMDQVRDVLVGSRSEAVKVLLPVHMFGMPAAMDEARELADRHGLIVLEDAANALGASYRGRPAGSLGDLAAFSFHPRKSFTTGEGGAVTTSNPKIDVAVRAWRSHGLIPSESRLECVLPGLNYRLSEVSAAIGVVQTAGLKDVIKKRAMLAARYHERLAGTEQCMLQVGSPHSESSWSSLIAVVDSACRATIMDALDAAGVDCTIGTYCIPAQPYYRKAYGLHPEMFPVATRIGEGGITLPLHVAMDLADVEFVCDAMLDALNRV